MKSTLPPAYAPVSTFRSAGDAHRTTSEQHILGVVRFTDEWAGPRLRDGHPEVGLHLAGSARDGFAEVWTSQRPVTGGEFDNITYGHDGEYVFCATHIPETADYPTATETAYSALLELLTSLGYPQIFRIWHYMSDINADSPRGMEVYREFCVGRAKVLERHGMSHDMPAATVIGAHGGGVFLYLLACRGGTQVNIENPRQVPAYHYPSKYGPKSPNFARATYFAPDGPGRIYVSGTAAILGHQTMHHGDVEQQCRLALGNIAQVIGTGTLSAYDLEPGHGLADLDQIKVYVRRSEDMARVRRICREYFAPTADIVFLNADICRSDLLVEIEGVVARAGSF
jgi:chorismatase